ncbi:MAG: transketolase [Clostridiales bacterium]|nr:transketolase [Clostridiales bacterium]
MDVNNLAVNTIRVISAEAIQKANSGHPGLPLGSAPIGYSLFANHLKFNPSNPKFFDRDRFILSAGHGSMLNYVLLHMFGYDLPMEEIKNFRQLNSKTPGHPEYGHTVGIETTTGPLGQGIANAVGMAIAETKLASEFNKDGYPIVDHYTYALCGDGCLQEGIAYEAASLAGTLKLGKLIVLYDKNDITIEGNINTAFTEDVGARHKAMGWQVIEVKNGNDVKAISKAIATAKKETKKPSLIIIKTVIGYGSPKQGTADVHGAPLGSQGIAELRANLDFEYPEFTVPDEVKKALAKYKTIGEKTEKKWNKLFESYKAKYPELAEKFENYLSGKLPDLTTNGNLFDFEKADATRNTSFKVLNRLAEIVPNLIGGSADLAPSNKSNMTGRSYYSAENRTGSNIHFGIREHAMSAISNGIALHGGLRAYCATFFIFSDYMKNAMRLSALMNIPVTYILTHDSIGVGEDGPTHQPVEQLIGLRSIPNMKVFRPADGKETAYAWISALTGTSPTCLVLTRQNLPQYDNSNIDALKGAYILADSNKETPDAILLASGSEVELIMKAKEELAKQNIDVRVVSVPCIEEFEKQSQEYKDKILPKTVRARVAVEMATPDSWYKYVGLDGKVIGMTTFGASAPFGDLLKKFGFTVENVVNTVKEVINK